MQIRLSEKPPIMDRRLRIWVTSPLDAAAANGSGDRRNEKEHDGDKENDLRDPDRRPCDPAKAKQCCNQRNHKKGKSPSEHTILHFEGAKAPDLQTKTQIDGFCFPAN